MTTLLRYSFPLERIFLPQSLSIRPARGGLSLVEQRTVYFVNVNLETRPAQKHKKIKFDKQKKVSSRNEGDGVQQIAPQIHAPLEFSSLNAEPTA